MSAQSNKKTVAIVLVAILIIVGFGYFFGNVVGNSPLTTNSKGDDTDQLVTKIVLDYLNQKYGDQQFTVTRVTQDLKIYSETHHEHIGFYVDVTSPVIPDEFYRTFNVVTTGTDPATTSPVHDSFASNYYSKLSIAEPTPNYAGTQYAMVVNYNIKTVYKESQGNFGHVPTIGELAGVGAINEITITMNDPNNPIFGDNENARIEHIAKLVNTIADYHQITSGSTTLQIFYYENGASAGSYRITVTESYLRVSNKNGTIQKRYSR